LSIRNINIFIIFILNILFFVSVYALGN